MERFRKESADASPQLDFHSIYDGWFEEVLRWARAMGGPDADCEDLVQDVFVVVHRRLPDFDGGDVGRWLYQIARRRVRDFLRSAWVKHLLFGSVALTDSLIANDVSPAEVLETKEKRELLVALLNRLTEGQRSALILFEVDGLSGEEIAKLLDVSVNAIWVRIHKARKKLRRALVGNEWEG